MIAAVDQLARELRLRRPIELLKAAIERHAVVAAVAFGLDVEHQHRRERVRHRRFRHQIAPPEFDAIDAEIGRHHVEQTLAAEVGFETPGPTIGAGRRLVRHQHHHIHVDVRDKIRPRHHLDEIARAGAADGAQIGTEIDRAVTAQRQDGAVARAGDLQLAFGIARMVGREQIFAAILDPFHRATGETRRERHEEIFRIEFAARTEAAADVELQHAHRQFRQVHHLRQHPPIGERHLGRATNDHLLLVCVPFGEQAARLHRHGRMALDAEMLAAGIGRVLERRFGVAAHGRHGVGDIGADLLEQQHVVLARRVAIRHRRQRLDIDHDRFERILGNRRAVRHDDGDRLADIAHLVVGDDRLLVALELRQRLLPQRNFRHVADIRRRDDSAHAGARARGLGIDGADAAVRNRAAQDDGVQDAVEREVVDILSAAGEKAEVFETLDRAADESVGGARMRYSHMTMVAFSLSNARATLSAASAEVFGLERDGLP